MIGDLIAPYIRKITPRVVLLGHARRCLRHLHLDAPGAGDVHDAEIGLVCFAIILVNWFGGVKYWEKACRPASSPSPSA